MLVAFGIRGFAQEGIGIGQWRTHMPYHQVIGVELFDNKVYAATPYELFTYDKEEDWKNALEEGVHSGEQDVSIVATHMMMQATDLGVGTLWINKFPNSETEKAFNLPASERSVLLMAVGYERDDCRPASLHTIRKPIEELVRYL